MAASQCSKIIENAFRRSGSLKRIKAELSVYYWPRVAGPEIAKKVTAVRYFNGYLYLKTESATLAHQLTMMNCDIIKRYQSILGSDILRGVKVAVGSIAPVSETSKSVVIFKLNEKEQQFIDDNCRQIEDPEMAIRFKAIMEKAILEKHRKQSCVNKVCLSCNVLIDSEYDYCPVCELKLKEELLCYFNYFKKNHQKIDFNQLPIELNAANMHLIRTMLKGTSVKK
jgi:hypothetical protein